MSKISRIPPANKISRIPAVKQFDVLLFAAVLTLTAVGYYFLYLVRQTYGGTYGLTDANMNRQLVAIGIGILAALFLSSVDYRHYQFPSYIGYIVSIVLLLLTTIFGAGGLTFGNRAWITIFGVNFQPSEFAKITFIVVSASFFERIVEKRATKLDYIKLLFYAAVPIALVELQGDTGTMLVFVVVFVVMIFVSGIKYRYIFTALGALIVAVPIAWTYVLRDYQKMRVMVFLNPELDKSNIGYQPTLARAAIASGELIGRQVENPSQYRYAMVPERHTDFIFTVFAERTGFIGSMLLIAVFIFILLRCFYIASKAQDRYGEFMVAGLTAMIMFHFIENIGMCIGIMPITGIPLPFISYGGTAMIANYVAIGIILSVSVTRDEPGLLE